MSGIKVQWINHQVELLDDLVLINSKNTNVRVPFEDREDVHVYERNGFPRWKFLGNNTIWFYILALNRDKYTEPPLINRLFFTRVTFENSNGALVDRNFTIFVNLHEREDKQALFKESIITLSKRSPLNLVKYLCIALNKERTI